MADYSIISENDKQFADEFSRFVNGKMSSAKKTGIELANDHRFLVQEKFKVAMFFIEQLAFWKNLLINFKIFFCHITFFINFAKIMDKLSKEYP